MNTNLSRWIKRVQATQEEEIDCSACLDHISTYVDLELATGDASTRLPQVKQHLEQCTVCSEEYLTLRELARLEGEGQLPTNEDLSQQL